jgi:NADH-quinone oxidoreductase subunit C
MALSLDILATRLQGTLGDALVSQVTRLGELTLVVRPEALPATLQALRDDPGLAFSQLIDLCGLDYQDYREGAWEGQRFAVVYHLLSLTHNVRVRVRVFCSDDDYPVIPTCVDVWPAANWFEREAFDLYGIVFDGHPDLRRILTDYGFIGHPFRKDFPLSGNVEMRYDPEQQRVIYQPVSIEPREVTPRIVRDDSYGEID